jgi:hypothetical protein
VSPDRVAGEVEAFLAGRLAEWLDAAGRRVPAWTVLNRVAHATWAELAALADEGLGRRAGRAAIDTYRWKAGQLLLVDVLLDTTSTPEDVERAQRDVLVPLELWLIRESAVEAYTSGEIVRVAWEALEDHLLGCNGA